MSGKTGLALLPGQIGSCLPEGSHLILVLAGAASLSACSADMGVFGPEKCHSIQLSLHSTAGSNGKSPGPQAPSGISHCSLLPHFPFYLGLTYCCAIYTVVSMPVLAL